MIKRDIIYIAICFLVFAVLKFVYAFVDTDTLQFLLMPSNKLIEIITGSKAIYSASAGYFHSQLNIVIDKSCSGYNFWLIGFLMASFLLIRSQSVKFIWVIPVALLASYLFTVLANVSRISGYMLLMRSGSTQYFDSGNTWLHQAEGIFVYLSFLIMFFFALNYTVTKIKSE